MTPANGVHNPCCRFFLLLFWIAEVLLDLKSPRLSDGRDSGKSDPKPPTPKIPLLLGPPLSVARRLAFYPCSVPLPSKPSIWTRYSRRSGRWAVAHPLRWWCQQRVTRWARSLGARFPIMANSRTWSRVRTPSHALEAPSDGATHSQPSRVRTLCLTSGVTGSLCGFLRSGLLRFICFSPCASRDLDRPLR